LFEGENFICSPISHFFFFSFLFFFIYIFTNVQRYLSLYSFLHWQFFLTVSSTSSWPPNSPPNSINQKIITSLKTHPCLRDN
jgi:hypothetical protein